MISCRYVGGDSASVGELGFESVGQRAEFPEEFFLDVVLGGAAFIPEAQFQSLGFTDSEISSFGSSGQRGDGSPAFVEKLDRAQEMYRSLRMELAGASKGQRSRIISAMTDRVVVTDKKGE